MSLARRQSEHRVSTAEWLVLVVLVATLGAEIVVWRTQHRSVEQLWHDFRAGAPREKVEALFTLTNRDQPHGFDQRFVRQLLRSEPPLLRELAMTHNLTRHSGFQAQEAHFESPWSSQDELTRCRFFLRFEERQFRRAALRAYFEALQDVPASARQGE